MATGKEVTVIAGNMGFDAKAVHDAVAAIEEALEKKEELSAEIHDIKEAAKKKGIPIDALNAVIRERKQRAKLGMVKMDALTDRIERLKHALGDFSGTMLGRAAIEVEIRDASE